MFIKFPISRRNALIGSIMLIAALGLLFTLPFYVEAASPCPADQRLVHDDDGGRRRG